MVVIVSSPMLNPRKQFWEQNTVFNQV